MIGLYVKQDSSEALQRKSSLIVKKEETSMTVASMILADLSLSTVVWWLVLGLIAGFLASVVMRGGGYGVVGDIVVGIVGAFIGGWLASLLGLGANGFIGSLIIAFIGACILIAILRAVSGGFGRRRI
jgi:uncharacterized membrane protein YeaQ/YmgE (transglycosylase-associated protein family)